MRSHRITILIAGIVVVAIAATPAAAHTSTLLSGYGGPGQGNQAILGSTVIVKGGGGSPGGGSGSAASGQVAGSAGAGEETGSEPSLVATEAPSGADHATSGTSSSGGHATAGSHPHATRAGSTATEHAARPSVAQASLYPASERLAPGQHDSALGLSSADLLFALLAAAVLVSLGVLTRRAGYADGRPSNGG